MRCENCSHWVLLRKTVYEDGTEIENWKAQERGFCEHLNQETSPEFGCTAFVEGGHEVIVRKDGAPWQNWHFGPCPECDGRGCHMVEMRPACRRCAGLGKVRHYDDGYIADASWDHPKEKAFKKQGITDPGLMLADIKKRAEGVFEGGSL